MKRIDGDVILKEELKAAEKHIGLGWVFPKKVASFDWWRKDNLIGLLM